VVLPNDFEIDAGYGVIYFDTEGGNRIALKSTIERGDEDIVEICVDDGNFMIQLAKIFQFKIRPFFLIIAISLNVTPSLHSSAFS
jgi:hypothetical protein